MVYTVVTFQNKWDYGSIWTMTYLKWQFHTQMWWGCPRSSQKIQSHPQWTRAVRLVCSLCWQVHCSRHQPRQLQRHWTLQSNVYRITQTFIVSTIQNKILSEMMPNFLSLCIKFFQHTFFYGFPKIKS